MFKVFPLLLLALFFSCASTTALTKEEQKKVVEIGNSAVSKLMGELKKNLGLALKEGGFPEAINFCADKAQKLTQKVNNELVLVKIKRVSDKYRNPNDRPSKVDLEAISYFKNHLKEGKLPPYYIKTEKKNGKKYVIYYKPIIVTSFCLNCHGDPKRMSPEVLRVLKERYPNDKALGYKVGDLRGVFRVDIPMERLKED